MVMMGVLYLFAALPMAPVSVGAALQAATTGCAILAAAARIDPPGPPFASAHLSQDVHQLKRQQLACNALEALARIHAGSQADEKRYTALRDARMDPLVACAATPSCCRDDGEVASLDRQSARLVARSLAALGALASADAVFAVQRGEPSSARAHDEPLQCLRHSATQLVRRAENLVDHMGLQDVVAARWAARRLLGNGVDSGTPLLNERTRGLPYDHIPGLIALPAVEEH